jgi:hypothetical protein
MVKYMESSWFGGIAVLLMIIGLVAWIWLTMRGDSKKE